MVLLLKILHNGGTHVAKALHDSYRFLLPSTETVLFKRTRRPPNRRSIDFESTYWVRDQRKQYMDKYNPTRQHHKIHNVEIDYNEEVVWSQPNALLQRWHRNVPLGEDKTHRNRFIPTRARPKFLTTRPLQRNKNSRRIKQTHQDKGNMQIQTAAVVKGKYTRTIVLSHATTAIKSST